MTGIKEERKEGGEGENDGRGRGRNGEREREREREKEVKGDREWRGIRKRAGEERAKRWDREK